MSVSLRRVEASNVTEAIEALEADGGVLLVNFATGDQVEALRSELAPHFERAEFGVEEYAGLQTRRVGLLIRRSPTMRQLVMHPTMRAVAAHFLGGEGGYQIHGTQAIDIGPGSAPQPLHTDDSHFPWPRPRPELEIVNLLAVDPFTEENGATRVIPGSHLWTQDQVPADDTPIAQAVMESGALCCILGSTWHSGGANRTAHNRVGARFSYSRGWLRQEENQYLVMPPEVVRELDKNLRSLLGYQVVNGLGVVFDPAFDDLIHQDIPPDVLEAIERARQQAGST